MTKLLVSAFLLLQLLYKVLAEVKCGGGLPSGYVRYHDVDKALKIHLNPVTWEEARRRCNAEGADLAVDITISMTNDIQYSIGNAWSWIGLHRPTGEGGDWVRDDTGQPVQAVVLNDYNSEEDRNCASLFIRSFHGRQISNQRCTNEYPFICIISDTQVCPDPVDPQYSRGTGSPLSIEPQGSTEPTVKCGGGLPSGYVRFAGDNTANKIYDDQLTWDEARERCRSEGADLAVANTSEKIKHTRNRGGYMLQWIGIHHPSDRGGAWFRVDTGQPITSLLPWNSYHIGKDAKHYNCALTYGTETITNFPCTYKLSAVCEISLAERCQEGVPDEEGSTVDAAAPDSQGLIVSTGYYIIKFLYIVYHTVAHV